MIWLQKCVHMTCVYTWFLTCNLKQYDHVLTLLTCQSLRWLTAWTLYNYPLFSSTFLCICHIQIHVISFKPFICVVNQSWKNWVSSLSRLRNWARKKVQQRCKPRFHFKLGKWFVSFGQKLLIIFLLPKLVPEF